MDYTKSTIKTGRFINIRDFNLAIGVLNNINNELENLFNQDKQLDLPYYYISNMDPKYKKRNGKLYGRYMHKIDRKVLTITPQMKYRHIMEIVNEAYRNLGEHRDIHQMTKNEKRIIDI